MMTMPQISSTAALPASQRYAVVIPGRLADRATTTVYVRRRLLVSLVAATILAMVWLGAGNVLANRGGAPASASAVRPAITYVVQPGDTLWSIAERYHGSTSQATYVDVLVQANGGAGIQIGQVITLP